MSGQSEDLVNEFDQLWDEMLPLLTASGYDKFASLKGKLTAAAKRVEEVEGILRDLTKSIECYSATRQPVDEWDEYDHMMFPVWQRAIACLATTALSAKGGGRE